MLAKINSAGLVGIEGRIVSVEVDESNGLPHSLIIGNVSLSVREALERCLVALKNCGIALPPRRLTISLQPADFHKSGTGYDLPILAGILSTLGIIDASLISDYGFFGEVGLDGRVLHVRGSLSLCSAFKAAGLKGAILSIDDCAEASVLDDIDVVGIRNLKELIALLSSEKSFRLFPRAGGDLNHINTTPVPDFLDVQGQSFAVRAALIAAAGGHNLLLSGSAGSGKSMIAKRIPGILPAITREEDIEVTKVYSVAGLMPPSQALYGRRPFRSPHSSITVPALIGGISGGMICPGELSLASKGVLFLDELPLFSRASIEALRQPIEDRAVHISRVKGDVSYPADCMIVAAMNPCPCGFFGSPGGKCHCSPSEIRRYQRGISKPILERLDLCVEVSPVSFEALKKGSSGQSSASLRKQVEMARSIQLKRFTNTAIRLNSEMGISELKSFCTLNMAEQTFIEKIFKARGLSMRTYHRILKLARTISDLEGSENIKTSHIAEALSYRSLEERLYNS